ncbi:MAG: hypothetical protein AB4426_35510 [Xenococcaceae cyanobacterium]
MTPETIGIISKLRDEFYSLFAEAMKVPVRITPKNRFNGNLPKVFWRDERKRLNYLLIYVYRAPDELIPDRPFILRSSINKGAGIVRPKKQKQGSLSANHNWHFELTLLPEEILDFVPWIISLIKSQEKGSNRFSNNPPHPLHFKASNMLDANGAWTEKAWQKSQIPNQATPLTSTLGNRERGTRNVTRAGGAGGQGERE